MADTRSIGVFDSGLGGLTVVKELRRLLPRENIIYFGDTGRVPYGNRSVETIKRYAKEDEIFLLKQNVKTIIAACGTVSSVAADVSSSLPIPFFEVVSHAALQATRATRNGKIGVIGTVATVKSEKHKEIIIKENSELQVFAQSCPLFVPLVEEGIYSEEDIVVKETVKRYLEPLKNKDIDTLILGCTHYPVLKKAVADYLGDAVTLINAGTATSQAVSSYLENENMLNNTEEKGSITFYVSDKADSFKRQAQVLLGEEIDEKEVKQVSLNSL